MRTALAAALAAAALAITGCGDDDGTPGVPAGFFGVAPQEAPTEADLARMSAGGVSSYRLLLSWARVDPGGGGNYDWSSYDELITRLAANGLEPVPYVYATPPALAEAATTGPTSARALDSFERFIAEAARRYGPGGELWVRLQRTAPEIEPRPLRTWEIWNEVNSTVFWSPEPSPRDYGRLLRRADRALAGTDPDARLMTAGMFATPASPGAVTSFRFLRELFAQPGITEAVDLVGAHPYAPSIAGVREQIERTRRVMSDAGLDEAGLWVTEIGWGSDAEQGGELAKTPEQQAELLENAYELFLAERERWRLGGALWYTWRDPAADGAPGICGWCRSAGLFDADLDPKPAWFSYAELAGGEPEP